MNHIEKEKLIKADIASIENRVRHAFNQGYDLGFKDGKEKAKPLEQEPTYVSELTQKAYENGKKDGYVQAKIEQEPTTKNDLGVERQIKEICISYPKSDLKEHDGQPYYSVNYIENGEEYEGYGTYKIEVLMEYLRNYFMPSVTPQLSSELEKNSQKLEKDFGELDCISRAEMLSYQQYLHGKMSNEENHKLWEFIKALPSVTPQEPKKGHWIVQPSNKEQGERDFIWWKCSECGQVIFSETEKDRKEFHAFCGRCGADMREVTV